MRQFYVRACAALMALAATNGFAETLADYVQSCRTELGFQSLPALNCFNGIHFAKRVDFGGPIDDWVVHSRITDNVDMVAACRWLSPDSTPAEDRRAFSLEMLVHNRDSGKTCFFRAREDIPALDPLVPFVIDPQTVSPTSSRADDYWMQPDDMNGINNPSRVRCTGCHVSGPYIVSARIAPALATFGLINDGHDTFADGINPTKKYRPVGAGQPGKAFEGWGALAESFAVRDSCSAACHILGSNSTFTDITGFGRQLIPSIRSDIAAMAQAGLMPPDDQHNVFRWFNSDNPFKAGDSGDSEKFSHIKAAYPRMQRDCGTPGTLSAHVVGSDLTFSTNSLPDKLEVFNARDGLVCNHADQANGQCNEYHTRYLCNGIWTNYQGRPRNANGDDERRSLQTGVCANPTAIQASVVVGNGTRRAYGPPDRLAKFDADGLECRNSDQGPGQACSNYVVRFTSCNSNPQTYGIVSSWTGRKLTATSTNNSAETRAQPHNPAWTSQGWVVEYIQPTAAVINVGNPRASSFVRIRNPWTNKYLNVQHEGNDATITTHELREDWTSMWWLVEPVAGTNDVRFRNVWSGRYVTVVETGDYARVLARQLATNAAGQRWSINR